MRDINKITRYLLSSGEPQEMESFEQVGRGTEVYDLIGFIFSFALFPEENRELKSFFLLEDRLKRLIDLEETAKVNCPSDINGKCREIRAGYDGKPVFQLFLEDKENIPVRLAFDNGLSVRLLTDRKASAKAQQQALPEEAKQKTPTSAENSINKKGNDTQEITAADSLAISKEYWNKRQLDQAEQYASLAITKKPDLLDAYYTRANIRIDAGSFAQAIEDCEVLLHRNPEYAQAYNMKGRAFEGQENFRQAWQAYTLACQKGDQNGCANMKNKRETWAAKLQGKTEQAVADGRHDMALDLADDLLTIDPNSSYAYTVKAHVFILQKRFKDAIEAGVKAVENDNKNDKAHYYLAVAYQRNNDHEKAREHYDTSCKLGFNAACSEFKKYGNDSEPAGNSVQMGINGGTP